MMYINSTIPLNNHQETLRYHLWFALRQMRDETPATTLHAVVQHATAKSITCEIYSRSGCFETTYEITVTADIVQQAFYAGQFPRWLLRFKSEHEIAEPEYDEHSSPLSSEPLWYPTGFDRDCYRCDKQMTVLQTVRDRALQLTMLELWCACGAHTFRWVNDEDYIPF